MASCHCDRHGTWKQWEHKIEIRVRSLLFSKHMAQRVGYFRGQGSLPQDLGRGGDKLTPGSPNKLRKIASAPIFSTSSSAADFFRCPQNISASFEAVLQANPTASTHLNSTRSTQNPLYSSPKQSRQHRSACACVLNSINMPQYLEWSVLNTLIYAIVSRYIFSFQHTQMGVRSLRMPMRTSVRRFQCDSRSMSSIQACTYYFRQIQKVYAELGAVSGGLGQTVPESSQTEGFPTQNAIYLDYNTSRIQAQYSRFSLFSAISKLSACINSQQQGSDRSIKSARVGRIVIL